MTNTHGMSAFLPKKLAADAVQRLADSEPTDDSIEGMERLRGTPQESMFVVDAAELQRVIECTLEDAIYDSQLPPPPPPPSETKLSEAIDRLITQAFYDGQAALKNDSSLVRLDLAARCSLESLYRDLEAERDNLRAAYNSEANSRVLFKANAEQNHTALLKALAERDAVGDELSGISEQFEMAIDELSALRSLQLTLEERMFITDGLLLHAPGWRIPEALSEKLRISSKATSEEL